MVVVIDDLPQLFQVLCCPFDDASARDISYIKIRVCTSQRGNINGLSLQAINESGVVELGHSRTPGNYNKENDLSGKDYA